MGDRHFSLLDDSGSDGRILLQPVADALKSPVEAAMPTLVSLAEVLEHCGVPNAVQATFAMFSHFGSVAALLAATAEEIRFRCEASPEIASLVAAFGSLHHATLCEEIKDRSTIASFDELCQFGFKRLRGCEIEKVLVLLLNHKNCFIREHPIRSGSVNHVQLYPREVVRLALLYNASSVVLIHNHPSGDPTPSREDIEMSRMVSNALSGVGIALQEHLIVGAKKVSGIRAMRLL